MVRRADQPQYLPDRLGANLDGMLAEYAVLSEEALVHLPSHLSFEEAATLPCAAVTAWVALARASANVILTRRRRAMRAAGAGRARPQARRVLHHMLADAKNGTISRGGV